MYKNFFKILLVGLIFGNLSWAVNSDYIENTQRFHRAGQTLLLQTGNDRRYDFVPFISDSITRGEYAIKQDIPTRFTQNKTHLIVGITAGEDYENVKFKVTLFSGNNGNFNSIDKERVLEIMIQELGIANLGIAPKVKITRDYIEYQYPLNLNATSEEGKLNSVPAVDMGEVVRSIYTLNLEVAKLRTFDFANYVKMARQIIKCDAIGFNLQ